MIEPLCRTHLGDCRALLPTYAWQPGDVVVTDPPYGTGGWKREATGQGKNPKGTLVREDWDDGLVDWLDLCVGAEAVITFWTPSLTLELLSRAKEVGFDKHRCLFMRKPDPRPMPGGRTKWSMEPIWVLSREGFLLYGGDDYMLAVQPRLGRDPNATGHPYEKPTSVMRWIIGKTRASRVIDPFAGSGTTIRAAYDLGVSAYGIEMDKKWVKVANERLAQKTLDFTPSPVVIVETPTSL